jgi:ankyrin repeat protein
VEVNSRDNDGRTPLSWAAQNRNTGAVQLFLQCDRVEVDSRDNAGRTPLSWAAAQSYNSDIVQLLLQSNRVEVNSRDNAGRTPLSWAAQNRDSKVIQLLLQHDQVEVDSRDNNCRTPLWHAFDPDNRYYETESAVIDNVVTFLTSGKVNPSAKDKDGLSPLSRAESKMRVLAGNANLADKFLSSWTKIIEAMRLCIEKAKVNDAEVCAHLISFIFKTDKPPGFRGRLPSRR